MTAPRALRRLLRAGLGLLLAAGCATPRATQPGRRVLVFVEPDPAASAAVADLRRLADPGEVALEVRDDPAVLVQDSLSRYSALVFLGAARDSLGRRALVEVERYAEAGGRVVAAGLPSDPAFGERVRAGLRFAGADAAPDFARARTVRVPEESRFEQRVLVEGTMDEPTELAVARDGRVFWIERKGALKVYEPRTDSARTIAQLDVFTENENGLIGIALDPGFGSNGWLYLNRTVGDTLSPKHRVARFTLAGDSIGDERVLFEVPITRGCCHTGGSMTFDPAGNLFISFGDNTNPFATSYAPIDDSPGRELWDARRSSANTQDLRGKILRITPRPDGTYGVPAGNLFTDPAVGRPEIYTMGHRNPYRISVDRRTGFLYWGEVGPDARVDSIWGPKGHDEFGQARRAGNFGWPLFIGDNKRYRDRDFATGQQGELFDPARPVNDSRFNTGAQLLPPAQPAFIWYPYDESPEFPLVGTGGRTAMAGPVYRAADFPDSPLRLPEYYDGKLIAYEWIRGWMRAVTMDEQGNYLRMEPFLEHLAFDHPMDMELGPDGSLYVLEYGTFWFARNPNARLSRIVYHPGNRPPSARVTLSRSVGAAPMEVVLSGRASSDQDAGDALSYSWTVDGRTIEGPEARHTFTQPGTHPVRLTVRDPSGATSVAETEVRVGNAPPEVSVAVQGNRSFFWDNAPLTYHVTVRDPEDGALGSGIAPERVRVTFDYLPRAVIEAPGELGHQADRTPVGLALMRQSDCMGCHAVDQVSVGPAFRMVAERYAGRPDAQAYVTRKIVQGSSGVWGDRVMPAHPALEGDVAEEMARYILSLAAGGATLPPSGTLALDRHQPGQSGAYVLTAAYVDEARNGIGPLRGIAEVTLRSPVVRAADVAGRRRVAVDSGTVLSGAREPLATVHGDGAHLHLGRTDLTGVGGVRVGVESQGHPFTLELRAGGPEGTVLASRTIAASPGPRAWAEIPLPLSTTGEHDLYLVFRSPAPDLGRWNPLLRVDALRFERAGSRPGG